MAHAFEKFGLMPMRGGDRFNGASGNRAVGTRPKHQNPGGWG
jgi:hypothetical protein